MYVYVCFRVMCTCVRACNYMIVFVRVYMLVIINKMSCMLITRLLYTLYITFQTEDI